MTTAKRCSDVVIAYIKRIMNLHEVTLEFQNSLLLNIFNILIFKMMDDIRD